jgi:hypothetical protein
MAKKKTKNAKKDAPAMAFHAKHKDGLHHIVGIGNLRVVLVPDGDVWFAQGLEIDYAAQGANEEDAKTQFENGLTSTIDEHLRVHGTIQKLLKVAPQSVWNELLFDAKSRYKLYTQVSDHEIDALPFAAIQYIAMASAA